MHIKNIRFGHASNSSSTHSMILIPSDLDLVEDWDGSLEFDDNFTLTSPEAKNAYLTQVIGSNLQVPDWARVAVVRELTGGTYDSSAYSNQGESAWDMPRDWDGHVHPEFARDLQAYLNRPDVAIIGGYNSNYARDVNEAMASGQVSPESFSGMRPFSSRWTARKEGDWWVLFDRESGNKMTFSFSENPAPRERAQIPELLDIKINQYCPFGCAFCSQASTQEGGHADLSEWSLTHYLVEDCKPFEVALGGGEPTLHPQLGTFAKQLNSSGINVNLTTRSLAWIRNLTPEVGQHFKAVGFSCHAASEVLKLVNVLPTWEGAPAFRLHVVVGSMPLQEIKNILQVAASVRMEVLLLGYKPVGFGEEYATHDMTGLFAFVLEMRSTLRLAIDTQLAVAWEEGLKDAQWGSLYYAEEGAFSGYYDLMAKELRPSSYAPKRFSVSVEGTHQLKGAWEAMEVYTPEPFLECM
jgi:hypothetical protein